MKRLALSLVLIFIAFVSHAQSRVVNHFADSFSISINESRVDVDGNVVNVGYKLYPGGKVPLIIKTDIKGNVLWAKYCNAGGSCEFVKVRIAANGDYLAIASGYYGVFIRIDKSGNNGWCKYFGYYNAHGEKATGIAELSNGNIAVCGYNDFKSYNGTAIQYQYSGYLAVFDAAGANNIYFKSYGREYDFQNDPSYDTYTFNDIATMGNRIYLCGMKNQYNNIGTDHALILTTDLDGNVITTKLMTDTLTVNNQALNDLSFLNISALNGKLYVNGAANTWNSYNTTTQIIGQVDTGSWAIKLQCLYAPTYSNFNSPKYFIKDTGEFYSVAVPSGTSGNFVSRIVNGNVLYTKKVSLDHLSALAVTVNRHDSVVLTGSIFNSVPALSTTYFGLYNLSVSDSLHCGVTDTVISLVAFNKTLITQTDTPRTIYRSPQFPYFPPVINQTIHLKKLCGDTATVNGIAETLPNQNKTDIYPNPASTTFNIVSHEDHVATMAIWDMTGRRLRCLKVEPGINRYSAPALGLKPGVYMLREEDRKGSAVQKLIVTGLD
jgi:hypothetical protein